MDRGYIDFERLLVFTPCPAFFVVRPRENVLLSGASTLRWIKRLARDPISPSLGRDRFRRADIPGSPPPPAVKRCSSSSAGLRASFSPTGRTLLYQAHIACDTVRPAMLVGGVVATERPRLQCAKLSRRSRRINRLRVSALLVLETRCTRLTRRDWSRAFNVQRSAFSVQRSAFSGETSPFPYSKAEQSKAAPTPSSIRTGKRQTANGER